MADLVFVLIFILIAVMVMLGVPLLAAFGLGSILLFMQSPAQSSLVTIGQMSVDGIFSFALLAVPLFIVTGDLIVATGVAKKLFSFANSMFGWIPGGLGTATQAACGLFAAISGSNTADAAAIGRISSQELQDRGYPIDYAGGMVASASITGILIPPSISYIVLGLVMDVSITNLFIGTIIPGIIVLGSMMIVHLVIARRIGVDQDTSPIVIGDILRTGWGARYGLLVPVIILGGLYAGVFTPTESATAAIIFMILVGVLIERNFTYTKYKDIMTRSAALNGMISPLVAIFTLFSQAIGFFQIPQTIADSIFGFAGGSEVLVVLMIILILSIAGTVISTIPNILLLGPLIIPVGVELGFEITHFSIFFLIVLAAGFITPPVGLNLFVLAGIMDEPVENLAVRAVPYFVITLVAAIIVLMVPETVHFLVPDLS